MQGNAVTKGTSWIISAFHSQCTVLQIVSKRHAFNQRNFSKQLHHGLLQTVTLNIGVISPERVGFQGCLLHS